MREKVLSQIVNANKIPCIYSGLTQFHLHAVCSITALAVVCGICISACLCAVHMLMVVFLQVGYSVMSHFTVIAG